MNAGASAQEEEIEARRGEEGENWGGGRQPRDECRSLSYSSNCQTNQPTNQHKTPNTKHKQQTQNTGSFDTSGSMIALAVPEIHCTRGFCDEEEESDILVLEFMSFLPFD